MDKTLAENSNLITSSAALVSGDVWVKSVVGGSFQQNGYKISCNFEIGNTIFIYCLYFDSWDHSIFECFKI